MRVKNRLAPRGGLARQRAPETRGSGKLRRFRRRKAVKIATSPRIFHTSSLEYFWRCFRRPAKRYASSAPAAPGGSSIEYRSCALFAMQFKSQFDQAIDQLRIRQPGVLPQLGGYILMAVKPGMVLSSFTKIYPVRFSRGRNRSGAMPVPSIARKARTAHSLKKRLTCFLVSSAGMTSLVPSSRYFAV